MASSPRDATDRQRLRAVLRDGPFTAHELSARAGVPERDVATHLEHLARSLSQEGLRLNVEPARCVGCGYDFPDRKRFGRPSRCPKCRGARLRAPRFWIVS
jgi:transcriptional regulator